MIQQQCYTRERKGLFRNSEGYDSVAKSAGLEDAFIKEHIHPFCFYHPSKALQTTGAPAEAYPPSLMLIHYADGRTLLGRTVYVNADFTGQRPTFFTHNYILTETEARWDRLLFETEFLSAYDIGQGKEMPVLNGLPRKTDAPIPGDDGSQWEALGLNREDFAILTQCLLQSVGGAKKTYVLPPAEPSESTDFVQGLLSVLFRWLPPPLLQNLGFCTYSREPENKKGLHLLFLEKGTVRLGDPRFSRDFLLDLSAGNDSSAISYGVKNSPFIDFLWDSLTQNQEVQAFYDFSRVFSVNFALSHWDGLVEIFQVYSRLSLFGRYEAARKKHLLALVKAYIPLCADDTSVNLVNFAARLVLDEAQSIANTDYLSDREIIEEAAGLYPFPLPKRLLAQLLYRYALKREEAYFYIADMARCAHIGLFGEYVQLLLEKREDGLLDGYLTERVRALPLHALFEEMAFWLTHEPAVFQGPTFVLCACARVRDVMAAAQDAITTANLAYKSVKDFYTEHPKPSPERFLLALMESIDAGLLLRLDFKTLSAEQLGKISAAFIQRGMNGNDPTPFVLLEILKRLCENLKPNAASIVNIRYFIGSYKLDSTSYQYVIHKLREFHTAYIESDRFDNLVFLFRNVYKPGLDLSGLLHYMDENGGAQKGLFIRWATENRVFNLQNNLSREEVSKFLRNNIKDSRFKEIIYENTELKLIAREIRFGRLAGIF